MQAARSEDLTPIRLEEYRPPAWLVDEVRLVFELHEKSTNVRAQLKLRRNPASTNGPADLRLDGRMLELKSASLDGRALSKKEYSVDAEGLTVPAAQLPNDVALWECETVINPSQNTALEGLYMSRDMFCTQCEAQGFRKITYFPDRPDVMSAYSVRIEADKRKYPVLLSNGDPIENGPSPNNYHYAEWRDPHKKPSYLFALVAGDLVATKDSFITASGREVELIIYTRPGDEDKTAYAMDALKRSMRWDEVHYGREYDLGLFMIVAVDDFNMGAMENKGLNIFNSKYVLASPETATDRDYELIESVVAHEYFHNWTGNRITCRDWFQLCLKEGLTVFRDQQFSEDERSAPVMRIDSAQMLRTRQFREDAGPLAHPVRPEAYVEINNFYTATVYEKGAEIVRMLHSLVGPKNYRAALDLYFERHDGQACTIEDFAKCFEDATGQDLTHFSQWWRQSGTPRVSVEAEHYDASAQQYRFTLTQSTPPTANQPHKKPLVIPVSFGLLGEDGRELFAGREVLSEERKTFTIENIAQKPVLSLNRGFCAPIILKQDLTDETRGFLLAHETDPFNRWEAGRAYAADVILKVAEDLSTGAAPRDVSPLADALGVALTDDSLDPAYRALIAVPPGQDELAALQAERHLAASGDAHVDPDQISAARKYVRREVARQLEPQLQALYAAMQTPGPYQPNAQDAGKRALRSACLAALAYLETPEVFALAYEQFLSADNMSARMPALTTLVHGGADEAPQALKNFYDRWSGDSLVLGKWFGVQATSPAPGALETVKALTDHPAFGWKNPNKFRSLIGAFAMGNPVNFHRKDGAGYKFFTDWLLKLDPVNPQTTAKLIGGFETWKRYEPKRRALMKEQLKRIKSTPKLSKDSAEIVTRLLEA